MFTIAAAALLFAGVTPTHAQIVHARGWVRKTLQVCSGDFASGEQAQADLYRKLEGDAFAELRNEVPSDRTTLQENSQLSEVKIQSRRAIGSSTSFTACGKVNAVILYR